MSSAYLQGKLDQAAYTGKTVDVSGWTVSQDKQAAIPGRPVGILEALATRIAK